MNNTILTYNCLFGDVEGAGARELPGGSMTKPILLYRKPDNRALHRSERRLSACWGKWTRALYLPCSVCLRIALYYRSISEVLQAFLKWFCWILLIMKEFIGKLKVITDIKDRYKLKTITSLTTQPRWEVSLI